MNLSIVDIETLKHLEELAMVMTYGGINLEL